MNKLLLCVFTLSLSFFAEPSFAVDLTNPCAGYKGCTNFEEGVAKVNMTLGSSDVVSAVVEKIKPPNGYVYSKAHMWGTGDPGGGGETSPPKTIIKSIVVLRNDEPIYIPLSAYADLSDPRIIDLEKLPEQGFRLTIIGSDAAGSYKAMLDFKKNDIPPTKIVYSGESPEGAEKTTNTFKPFYEISRRKVVSGEFPDDAWEETTYTFNHLDN